MLGEKFTLSVVEVSPSRPTNFNPCSILNEDFSFLKSYTGQEVYTKHSRSEPQVGQQKKPNHN
jgi:hypothetical protein